MTTINRTIETEHDRTMAARLIEARSIPFTFTLTDGKHRTTKQNKLQRLWMNEIAEQKGDTTPEEARAYCKLTIGVPILRAQNEAFRIRYDEVVKPLPYEQKLAIMSEPLDLPVTRIMTTKQKTEYLDGIIRHFAEQGIVLTMPDDLREQHSNPSGEFPSPDGGSDGSPEPPSTQAVAASPIEPAEAADLTTDGGIEAPADPDALPSVDLIALKREAIDKFLIAATDPTIPDAKGRQATVIFAKDAWKQMLPTELEFVRACTDTANKVVKSELKEAAARKYLESLL